MINVWKWMELEVKCKEVYGTGREMFQSGFNWMENVWQWME